MFLTVRFLESRTGTASTILLGFTTTRIRNQKGSVVRNQSLSQLVLRAFIHVLRVVSNNGLGNSGSDGIDLSSDTSTLHSDADIQIGKLILTNNQNGLKNLQAKYLRLDVLNRLAINLDKTTALLGECNSGCCLLPTI